jgi:hypothetical protein
MNYKKMTFRASMLGLIVMLFAGLVSAAVMMMTKISL